MIKTGMKKNLNDQGQVLLIVVVAMAITLGVGLGITSRSTESLKRTGNLDSLQKVTAAAEGALEKLLIRSDNELENYLASGGQSTFSQDFSNGTTAIVTVSGLTAGSSGMIYEKIKPSETVTFLTTEFSGASPTLNAVSACVKLEIIPSNTSYMLNVITSNPNPNVVLTGSDPDKTLTNTYLMEKYVFDGVSFKLPATTQGNCSSGYTYFANSLMLRFQPLSNEVTTLKISTTTSSVQKILQGFKLSSKGMFQDLYSSDKTTRTVEAYKYLDTASSIYDFAAYIDN